MFLLCVLQAFVSCSKETDLPSVEDECIFVSGVGLQIQALDKNVNLYTDRSAYFSEVCSDLSGYSFISYNAGGTKGGLYKSNKNTYISVLAPLGCLDSPWSLSEQDCAFYYDNGIRNPLSKYIRKISSNVDYELPLSSSGEPVFIIGKNIEYVDVALCVDGYLIDIRSVLPGERVYPQNTTVFDADLPNFMRGQKIAVGLEELKGPTRFKAGFPCVVNLAASAKINDDDWEITEDKFMVGGIEYYIYKYEYNGNGQWAYIPDNASENSSVMLIAPNIQVFTGIPPGNVITKTNVLRDSKITNPTIAILPNGDYVVACSGANRSSTSKNGPSVYRSVDKGKNWELLAANICSMSFYSFFVFDGKLYLIGTQGSSGNIIIIRSDDNGETWTLPKDTDSGILRYGDFSSAPVPVVVFGNRIWRAFEKNIEKYSQGAFVISADIDSDLLKSSSWTVSNVIEYDTSWYPGEAVTKRWLEGNVVVGPDGLVDILRVDDETSSDIAAIVNVESPEKVSFDSKDGFVELPGGGKKFTIRYDDVSGCYLTLTNPIYDTDGTYSHSGIYKDGLPVGFIRNHLVLYCSKDLRKWNFVKEILSDDDPFFHAFQYIDWQIDGDDLIFVSRTAYPESRGLPEKQHDANMMTFHKITDFRNLL